MTSKLGLTLSGLSIALLSMTTAEDAAACGGLFCANTNPVNQAAERIIFSSDGGTVTAAIEIQYQGPAHEFAWVLPVPAGEVEVGVASTVSFDRLQAASNPQYNLQVTFDERCVDQGVSVRGSVGAGGTTSAPTDAAEADDGGNEAVTVVNEGKAGPYDYVQIEVDESADDPADVAIEWLTEEGYDVTDTGPDVLRPYLADGLNLIAFRLSKDEESGSIRPLLLTYESDNPMIPIIPTAVAALPDMGVMVWVLGSGRAIPSNFYHLELNEAVIDWFNPNPTYNDVIIAAADEAGGQGFVTEQSGAAGQFSESIYASWEQQQWESLRTSPFDSIQQFIQLAINAFGSYDGFAEVLADPEVFPLREGATVEQFITCSSCYFQEDVAVMNEAYPSTPYDPETDPLNNMDVVAFLDKMDELVITPLSAVRDLFDNNETVTRLYTTLSPEEMTVDPVFDYNAELPGFDNIHTANQIMQCGEDETEWRIELPQGMTINGNARTWPITLDSDFPVNFRIVQLSTEGQGEVVDSNLGEIGDLLTDTGFGTPSDEMVDAMDEPDLDTTDTDADTDTDTDNTDVDTDTDMDTDTDTDVIDNTDTDTDADSTDMDTDTDSDSDSSSSDSSTSTDSDSSSDSSAGTDADDLDTDEMQASAESGGGCAVGTNGSSKPSGVALLSLLGLGLALRRRRH